MTPAAQLERWYRRLLALYPRRHRAAHEEEILAVLMAGAAPGQRRPRPGEVSDLVLNGVRARARGTRLPSAWEYRHARVMLPLRLLIGAWLVILTTILYGSGRGGLWALLLVPSAALHFFLAFRLRHVPAR